MRSWWQRVAVAGLLAWSVAMPRPAGAGDIALDAIGLAARVPVKSVRELRFRGVVPQKYDFSCGSAALATLLTYHYGRPVAEDEVFREMLTQGDEPTIRAKGFSLLDMKRLLERRGLTANGYREGLDRLRTVGIPAIVLINTRGYQHFVVITGVTADAVAVADPALGAQVHPRADFERRWNGLLFVVESEMAVARASFNQPSAWRARPRAPLGRALPIEGLALIPWALPKPNDF